MHLCSFKLNAKEITIQVAKYAYMYTIIMWIPCQTVECQKNPSYIVNMNTIVVVVIVVIVAFPRWTLWGSPSMCTHTCTCTGTGTVHRGERIACATVFNYPPYRQPHSIFGGMNTIITWHKISISDTPGNQLFLSSTIHNEKKKFLLLVSMTKHLGERHMNRYSC